MYKALHVAINMCTSYGFYTFIERYDVKCQTLTQSTRVTRTDVWKGRRFRWQKLVDWDLVHTQRYQYRHACSNSTQNCLQKYRFTITQPTPEIYGPQEYMGWHGYSALRGVEASAPQTSIRQGHGNCRDPMERKEVGPLTSSDTGPTAILSESAELHKFQARFVVR